MTLNNIDINKLSGVGPKLKETLARIGIHSVQDLLFHLPLRYLDRTKVTPIASLRTNTSVVIEARVVSTQIAFGRRRSLAVNVEDTTGQTCLRFYHFSNAQKNNLQQGTLLRVYGDPRLGTSGIELYHPEYDFIDETQPIQNEETLTPVYPTTEGLQQARIRKLVAQAVNMLESEKAEELLQENINQEFGVTSLGRALAFLHYPPAADASAQVIESILNGIHPCQNRLAFEELLAHFITRQRRRLKLQSKRAARIAHAEQTAQVFIETLQFTLTNAQARALEDVRQDLAKGVPMLRLVQGDVGCGKTLVAALASIDVIHAGYQVALVAPTEILAEQHLKNFKQWLEPLGYKVTWLAGKLKVRERRQALSDIASGEAHVVVGTHALFQEDVVFRCLGLSIIDEQHRFGVEQRLSLSKSNNDGLTPHQLVMTATPIPRSLAMTAYADLDYSVIDELPPGRSPVQTALVSQDRKDQLIARVQHACSLGAQVYWVCPLVEDSETLSVANAEETYEQLHALLPQQKVGLVHGRLKAKEKEQVMAAFKAAELDILVATTVIEVGVDVPNATLMIIENPERLGLAQLHQLRGRVGRGSKESHCVLLYGEKLSQQAKERLHVMRQSNDGFVIAEKDLQLRGPGELLGTRQTGDLCYRVADIQQHDWLLPKVQQYGQQLVLQNKELGDKLIARWIGENQQYAGA
ncbi:MAG: ATP-dependent DNA helicase RecG [Agarilytica sp.]